MMKLTFSPASPYARKVRIAAIELGLIDKIELVPTTVQPTKSNAEYQRDISPLRKLPALILDSGSAIVDSYVIVEYLDDLAGGGKLIPASGDMKWRVKTEHSILRACWKRCCSAATKPSCGPRTSGGRPGSTISGTVPGRV
jgi:glutathione S-transferase